MTPGQWRVFREKVVSSEHLVAGSWPMGSGRAQSKEATCDTLPVGKQPAGGAKQIVCTVYWEVAEGRELGGLIPGWRS